MISHNIATDQPRPQPQTAEPLSKLVTDTSLNADFASLLLNIQQILSNCPNQQVNLEACKDYCSLLRIGGNSNELLFEAKIIDKIKGCVNFKQLFEIVSRHMSWDEHSILTQMVDH